MNRNQRQKNSSSLRENTKRGIEVISLFLYQICNPRSDYKIEEQIDEPKLEAEELKFFQRLKILLGKEEAEHKRSEAELKRLRTTSESNSVPPEEEKTNKDLYLPSDLVRVILSRLALKDNIRSSSVCKTWCEIAASVRVRDPPCWLMYLAPYHTNGVSYGFYDPVEKKKTKAMMGLPELSECSCVLYSNDGWLLIDDRPSDVTHFLFNPFTRERINLPTNGLIMGRGMEFAFSCAPTKKDCLVIGIEVSGQGRVRISTCHLGATTWVDEDFPDVTPIGRRLTKNILYSDGLFYLATEVSLGVFDASARTWNVLPLQPITIPGVDACNTIRWLTECKGQIYLVDASSAEPMVFRLNRLESVWEKKETLDGSSIFVSKGSCVMASGLTGSMSNILYFCNRPVKRRFTIKHPQVFDWNRPFKYSLYSRSLCEEREGYYLDYRMPPGSTYYGLTDNVWIEPPHNISISDYSLLPFDFINTRLFIWNSRLVSLLS